jgi:hypothetical protein
MEEKQLDEATMALIRWFKSQQIDPEDAVVIMAQAILTAIHLHSEDPKEIKKGKDIVARMIKESD